MSLHLLQKAIESIKPTQSDENTVKSLEFYYTMNLPDDLKQIIWDKLAEIDEYKHERIQKIQQEEEYLENLRKDPLFYYYSID